MLMDKFRYWEQTQVYNILKPIQIIKKTTTKTVVIDIFKSDFKKLNNKN